MQYQTYPDQVKSVHHSRYRHPDPVTYKSYYWLIETRAGEFINVPGSDQYDDPSLEDIRVDGPWEHQHDVKVKNVLYHFGRNYGGSFDKLCLQRPAENREHIYEAHRPSHVNLTYSDRCSRTDGELGFISGYRLIIVGHGPAVSQERGTLTHGIVHPRAYYDPDYCNVGSWVFDFSRQMWNPQRTVVLATSVNIEAYKCCNIGESLTLNVRGPGWDGKIAYFDLFGWVFGVQDLPEYFEWDEEPS